MIIGENGNIINNEPSEEYTTFTVEQLKAVPFVANNWTTVELLLQGSNDTLDAGLNPVEVTSQNVRLFERLQSAWINTLQDEQDYTNFVESNALELGLTVLDSQLAADVLEFLDLL